MCEDDDCARVIKNIFQLPLNVFIVCRIVIFAAGSLGWKIVCVLQNNCLKDNFRELLSGNNFVSLQKL